MVKVFQIFTMLGFPRLRLASNLSP